MIYWKVAFIHFERTSCMERNLTTGSIGKAVLVFSVPYLITYFLQMFYGMADLFIVGQYNGVDEITAVAVGSQIMHMATVMLVGLAMGTTVCIARAVGAGDKERIAQAVGNTSILFFGVSLAATILTLLFLDSIVSLMATPAAAVPGTTSYLFVCFLGIPFITAYNVISAMFRGLGDTKSPLYFVAVACILNIALDYFFIGGMGLGAKGAAYATVLAQASSVLFSLIYIRLRDTGITLKLSCLRPNHAVFRELLRVGVPICMQDAFIQITFIILTIIANSRGLEQAAAVGIVEKLLPDVDFVCVLGGTEDRPPKPDTAIIVDILSRLPDEKNQVFMIGDSNVDIQTGHNAGIETIGCAWGFRGREELEREGADYIAEAPADIVGFVTGKKDQA